MRKRSSITVNRLNFEYTSGSTFIAVKALDPAPALIASFIFQLPEGVNEQSGVRAEIERRLEQAQSKQEVITDVEIN